MGAFCIRVLRTMLRAPGGEVVFAESGDHLISVRMEVDHEGIGTSGLQRQWQLQNCRVRSSA